MKAAALKRGYAGASGTAQCECDRGVAHDAVPHRWPPEAIVHHGAVG